jgi:type I restriction enzyme S subunit
MSKSYSMVPLGDVIRQRSEFIEIDDFKAYKRCRVQLHAQGIVQRDIVQGVEIKTKKQQICHAGEFLVAEIDAKVGGFGIVPDDLDGSIVSGHYFLFNIDEAVLNRRFLEFFIRNPAFMEQVKAQGTTNYAAIRPGDVLGYKVPLPSLEEQQRIVARIEELAARIEEARRLRKQLREDCNALCRSILTDTSDGTSTLTPMRELVRLREPDITVSPEEIYWFAGVYSFGRGLFQGQRRSGAEFAYTRLTHLRTDNFVYPKLMAWEGAFAVVPTECDGLVVSPEFPVFEIDQQHVLPETLDVYFRMPSVWSAVSGASTGTNVRRRRLNPADFLAFVIPLPSMKTQKRLREVKIRVDLMSQLQSETSAELDALLPSILDKAFKGEL